MSFERTYRIFALTSERMAELFPILLANHSETLTGIQTIAAFADTSDTSGSIYAAIDSFNITPIILNDGRLAFRALWQQDVVNLLPIDGVEELTLEQLALLTA